MPTFTGTATVNDTAGQTATAPVTIIETAPQLTISAIVAPTSGPPGTKFTITATGHGGVPPFTYAISPINGVQPTPDPTTAGVWTITL